MPITSTIYLICLPFYLIFQKCFVLSYIPGSNINNVIMIIMFIITITALLMIGLERRRRWRRKKNSKKGEICWGHKPSQNNTTLNITFIQQQWAKFTFYFCTSKYWNYYPLVTVVCYLVKVNNPRHVTLNHTINLSQLLRWGLMHPTLYWQALCCTHVTLFKFLPIVIEFSSNLIN